MYKIIDRPTSFAKPSVWFCLLASSGSVEFTDKRSMDVKGLVRSMIPIGLQSAKDARRAPRADSTAERDGNGQQASSGEQQRRKLSQDEVEEAVKALEALAGVKEHGLRVRLVQKDDVTVVFVEDALGKVVRRIPESELGALLGNKEKKSGHLFDKAM